MQQHTNKLAAILACCAMTVALSSCGSSGEKSSTAESGAKTSAAKTEGEEAASTSQTPVVPVVCIESHRLERKMTLPGELEAYQDVPIHAKVEGFIKWIGVDRGSVVHKDQPLIVIAAPELDDKVKEAQAKVSAADAAYRQSQSALQGEISKQVEAKAKLEADKLTASRLEIAAKTPGAIAQNEVDLADKTVEEDAARLDAIGAEIMAARNLVSSQKNNLEATINLFKSLGSLHSYLTVRAPFNGVITERNVHEGSIVAVESSRIGLPLLRIQEKKLLRLVVAVPEDCVGGIKLGEKVPFTVPAFVGKTFEGTVARLGYALDTKTRTMPVELNVPNGDGMLEPGMFATVTWIATRPYNTMFLPSSAVGEDLKGTFVNRVVDGLSQRVRVSRGQSMGNLVEVVGDLKPGDQVALKATDELKSGTHLIAKLAGESDIEKAGEKSSAGGE